MYLCDQDPAGFSFKKIDGQDVEVPCFAKESINTVLDVLIIPILTNSKKMTFEAFRAVRSHEDIA